MKITGFNEQALAMGQKSALDRTPKAPAERADPEMWKAAESFEAIFMSKLFKDSFLVVSSKIISLALGLISSIFFIRLIGAAGKGSLSVLEASAAFFVLITSLNLNLSIMKKFLLLMLLVLRWRLTPLLLVCRILWPYLSWI